MSLCSNCLQLARTVSAIALGENSSITAEQPFIHYLSSEKEETCNLCDLLKRRYKQCHNNKMKVWPIWSRVINELDANLCVWNGPKRSQDLVELAISLYMPQKPSDSSATKGNGSSPHQYHRFRIYCHWGSPAARISSLSHRYRLHNTGSIDAMEMMRTWLAYCKTSHSQCHVGDFFDKALDIECELPTRVVDIGPRDGSVEPRLFVSNGLKGHWIALSHCWGNEFLQPLKTTRQNFIRHQKCIPMSILPKTFHDAVLVARGLDIRYLWIDSLCIIQDDDNDQKWEFPRMGHIYQYAHLTIMASEATNCSDGLFYDTSISPQFLIKEAREENAWGNVETHSGVIVHEGIPSVAGRVELPFTHGNEREGSFFITFMAEGEASDKPEQFPRFTPLFNRAWVTQEWTLSRRSLLFLRDGIVWSCREYCENERGHNLSLRRPELENWQAFVMKYTMGSLTFAGDRLNAVRGLVKSWQLKRNEEYFLGLWKRDLPDGLLWRVRWEKGVTNELQYVPSWSWARHIGLIGFQLYGSPRFDRHPRSDLVDLAESLDISHSGVLRLRTYLGWVQTIEEFDYHHQRRHKAFLKFGFRGYSNCRQVVPLIESVWAQMENGGLDRKGLSTILDRVGPLGWADWDVRSIPDGPIAWAALKLERNCLQQYGCSDALHVLYLRLEPHSSKENRFERVGMGVIGCTIDLSHAERLSLEIV